MEGKNGKTNGRSLDQRDQTNGQNPAQNKDTPRVIQDLADACVRFVERAINFKLNFEAETLPVLDHYVDQARKAAAERPETAALVAPAVGAYLGEIIRRKFGGFWRLEDTNDPRSFRVELEPVYLILRPIELATRALDLPPTQPTPDAPQEKVENDEPNENDEEDENTRDAHGAQAPKPSEDPNDDINAAILELDEEDKQAVADKLVNMPPVPDTEYYAPSTYLEIVELIVSALRTKRSADGMEPDAHLEPDDYS